MWLKLVLSLRTIFPESVHSALIRTLFFLSIINSSEFQLMGFITYESECLEFKGLLPFVQALCVKMAFILLRIDWQNILRKIRKLFAINVSFGTNNSI